MHEQIYSEIARWWVYIYLIRCKSVQVSVVLVECLGHGFG